MQQFNWKLGIGDPSIGGWLTVLLYCACAFSCWKTARKLSQEHASRAADSPVWGGVSILFIALGINKQLDLQTALTELGRITAQYQGWYGHRHIVQLAFIVFVALTCVFAVIILSLRVRDSDRATWAAVVGTTLVLGFVLMRAASFHHIDQFIGTRIVGLRWNWILEMGGIIIVLVASQLRQKVVSQPHPVRDASE